MATEQPKVIESLGNIPAVRNTYFTEEVPTVALTEHQRLSIIRFKVDKKTSTLRRKMAVVVNKLQPGEVIRGHEKGSQFLADLLADYQDSIAAACASGKCTFDTVDDTAKLIQDYYDTTRAGGNRITSEAVGKWFDSALSDWLMGKIIAKFPTWDADKVAGTVAQYRTSFADLAKYQLGHTKPVYTALQKAWNEAQAAELDLDDDMVEWVSGRLKKLNDRHNAAEMFVDAI